MNTPQVTLSLACNMDAIEESKRHQHGLLAAQLMFEAFQERQELPDGYAFRFAAADYPRLVEYIANERLCCPFFQFELDVEPQQGPVWLRIRGGQEVKEFLTAQFNQEQTAQPA